MNSITKRDCGNEWELPGGNLYSWWQLEDQERSQCQRKEIAGDDEWLSVLDGHKPAMEIKIIMIFSRTESSFWLPLLFNSELTSPTYRAYFLSYSFVTLFAQSFNQAFDVKECRSDIKIHMIHDDELVRNCQHRQQRRHKISRLNVKALGVIVDIPSPLGSTWIPVAWVSDIPQRLKEQNVEEKRSNR